MKAFGSEIGSQDSLGFFDPLEMLTDADQERFNRLRYDQIKHVCIAQLTLLGQITTRNDIHLPGEIDYSSESFDSFLNGLSDISGPDSIPKEVLLHLVALIGYLELVVMKDSANGADPGEVVGDFRNGAIDFEWDTFDEDTKISKRAIETNNGRAAMMGILVLMVHEKLGGSVPMVGEL